MNWNRYLVITLLAAICLALGARQSLAQGELRAAPPARWDFEKEGDVKGWREPGADSGVIADPAAPSNHGYQIVATKPHHTQLVLIGSDASPDFVVSLRVKVLSSEGEPPAVYLYGRLSSGGFRGLSIRPTEATAFCYFGPSAPSTQLGRVDVPAGWNENTWLCTKLACYQEQVFAKVWLDGAPEPRWQIAGTAEGPRKGKFAVGVWTSPRTPSKACVLFDNITFQAIGKEDLPSLRLPSTSHKPLDLTAIPLKSSTFDTATDVGLASASTVVAFDKETAAMTHLVHRASGQDFISNELAQPLFRITLTKPQAGKRTAITAADFDKVAITKTDAGKLELNFSHHSSLPLTARVTAASGADGFVRLRIVVGNKSDWAVSSIHFPQFAAPAKLGQDAADDRLLLPLAATDGAVIESPGTRTQSRESLYPGHACVQFAALYDQTAGLYVASEDPAGHCKRWDLRTVQGKSVEFPLVHLIPEVVGAQVTLPYDVVLGTFTGDWRDAADIYKRWAKRQPWCAKTLTDRDDIPQFLKDGSGVIIAGIQNAKGYNGILGDNLERLPRLMADYRQHSGLAHMIFVPYGWEGQGTWAGIHYLPATPSNEAWQKANAVLRAQGDRVAMLTSGFWWVVKRQESRNGPAIDDTADFQRRKEMVVQNADGTAWTFDNYDRANRNAEWRGLSVKLCHGSKASRETLLSMFLDLARLGTPLLSFDQEIGGGQNVPCYSQSHGHPPGFGSWMWTDFRDLCAEILRQAKTIRPELGLLMENCSELTIPYSATYWSRQFGEVDHGLVGARGVALFSYLYHEYVTAIGAACLQGQGAHGTQPSAELRCYVLGNNLTRGLIPGPFMQDVPLDPADPWHRMVSSAYFTFCQPYARFPEYLLRGNTCRPPTIECNEQEVWFYRQDARGQSLTPGEPKLVKGTARLPAVTAGSFAAEDGSIGTVIVNMTAQPRVATVKLTGKKRAAVLYLADRTDVRHWQPSPAEIELSLEPFGVRLLVQR